MKTTKIHALTWIFLSPLANALGTITQLLNYSITHLFTYLLTHLSIHSLVHIFNPLPHVPSSPMANLSLWAIFGGLLLMLALYVVGTNKAQQPISKVWMSMR